MSIDATIAFVQCTEHQGHPASELTLIDRPPGDSGQSWGIAGQSTMWIIEPTWEPEIGMEIWGGSGIVEIVDGPDDGHRPVYRREGYTRLREALDYVRGRFVNGARDNRGDCPACGHWVNYRAGVCPGCGAELGRS